MSFWMRGKQATKADTDKATEAQSGRKRKEEKKAPHVKRLDNLRIPHQLSVVIKSIGTRSEFGFVTKDLSVSGAFVKCDKMHSYPFQVSSTILECEVNMGSQSTPPNTKVEFLARIARVVEAAGGGQSEEKGFGIRIVQISPEHRLMLESFVSAHGTVDGSLVSEGASQGDSGQGALADESENSLADAV
jgi:hypothetical protein